MPSITPGMLFGKPGLPHGFRFLKLGIEKDMDENTRDGIWVMHVCKHSHLNRKSFFALSDDGARWEYITDDL